MGADGFVIYYGVRYLLSDEEEVRMVQDSSHARLQAAARVGLQYWWGLTPEKNIFLLIGTQIGNLGQEGASHRQIEDEQLFAILRTTQVKLAEAEIEQVPALHAQFEPHS